MSRYGKVISKYRKEKGYTQNKLAELLYVTPQAVSKWENNQSEPDLETIKKLSQIFNIGMDEFFSINNKELVAEVDDNVFPCECCGLTKDVDSLRQVKPNIICHECYNKLKEEEVMINNIINYQDKQKEITYAKRYRPFYIGAIVGLILTILFSLSAFTLEPTDSVSDYILGSVVLVILGIGFTTQMLYPSWLRGFLSNFWNRIIGLPGIIFELSVGGIITFILVKIVLGILVLLLSLIIFMLGLILTLIICPFTYVYELIKIIKTKEVNVK